ncbi:MAG: aldehyde dehydrogenase family protein [Acidihalobacter sp.]|uniref:aldehyde dehydrogenase family protein n=1 Tax=Acidihalobacter sp. TaxID=1872108 RepID=UPI00307E4223
MTSHELLAEQRTRIRQLGPPGYAERRDALDALADLLARRDELAELMAADFGGRAAREVEILELCPLHSELRYVRRHLRGWMRGRSAATAWPFWPARARLLPRPLGVVGIIGAWNYPLLLTVLPMIAALAAGNSLMLKMPRLVPRTGAWLQRELEQTFGREYVAVLNGGADLSKEFPGLAFDHLVFSGSTRTGRVVARAAARNLVPATLSLSGKTPAIVAPGYPLERAARRIMAGKLLNAGQTCIAPDYALVPEGQVEAFVKAAESAAGALYPRLVEDGDYTRIPSSMLYARLDALLEDARRQGARVRVVNPRGEPCTVENGVFAPALVSEVTESAKLMQEEIFGPILPVLPYADENDAAALVERHPDPLALYVFDEDTDRARRTVARLRAGGASINDTLFHVAQPGLPFGGIGGSGIGQYRGEHGFRRFSHYQGVFEQSRWSVTDWVRPPYGLRTQLLMRLVLGRGKGRR